jgi:peptidoglycan/LPS O-acetylase OafA/YrhL
MSAHEGYVRTSWKELGPVGWAGLLTLTGGFLPPAGWLLWEKTAVVNLAFWTLAIEVQFYLVVGLAVRARQNFYRVIALVTAVSFPFVPSAEVFRTAWFLPYWPMFALGVGLYAAVERQRTVGTKSGRWASLLVGVGMCGLGLVTAPGYPAGGIEMMLPELALAAGFTALLWGLRPIGRGEAVGGVPGYLGRVSYSLYLLHVPLMLLAGHAVGGWLSPGTVPFAAAVAVGVCLLVYPFYRWVERPCMSQASLRPRQAVV